MTCLIMFIIAESIPDQKICIRILHQRKHSFKTLDLIFCTLVIIYQWIGTHFLPTWCKPPHSSNHMMSLIGGGIVLERAPDVTWTNEEGCKVNVHQGCCRIQAVRERYQNKKKLSYQHSKLHSPH